MARALSLSRASLVRDGPSPPKKRPQWIMLGKHADLVSASRRGPHGARVHDTDLVVFTSDNGDLMIAKDACPHRGASLARGKVRGACVVCPYHALPVGRDTWPAHFYSYVRRGPRDNSVVWLDCTSDSSTHPWDPPSFPEHQDPAMRTFAYTRKFGPEVNPVLMAENMMDYLHLDPVHLVTFVRGAPRVTIVRTGHHGLAEYAYDSLDGKYDVLVQNEYQLPFTTSLRFVITERDTGAALPALLLAFNICPMGDRGTLLHHQISRPALPRASPSSPAPKWARSLADAVVGAVEAVGDLVFMATDELPLWEDARIVRNTYPSAWSSNALNGTDEFIAAYRAAMRAEFPGLLERYVS
jgi:hypothetical protein